MAEKKLTNKKRKELREKASWVRERVLDMALSVGAGHIAPAFSCVEILVFLYHGGVLRVDSGNPKWEERDRFVLSKGHASIALYPVLASKGFFPLSELDRFSSEGGRLGVHAESAIPGVEVTTGSLGHGLSIGAGMALAAKLDSKKHIVIILAGDGECYEGAIWEAALFAGNFRLNNLAVIVDYNGFSATSFIKKHLSLRRFKNRWESFGWEVKNVNGHSFDSLYRALKNIHSRRSTKPLAIIAVTTKGKGISFMENRAIWHYRVPSGEEIDIAKGELSSRKNHW